ncbi:hypothetical protein ACLB2K_033498 [Fragaria x ananassa]
MAGDSGKDKAIVVRVSGVHCNYWYVIEEKSAIDVDDDNTMIGCKSDHDRVRRLCRVNEDQEPLVWSSSLVVINSTIYLIGGDGCCLPESDDERVTYQRLDLGGGGRRPDGGGNLMSYQGGGAAVGPDGNIYTVGYNIYRFSPHETFHEELVFPPCRNYIKEARLLGVTSKTLFVYTVEGGVDGANRMLGFDFESRRWDILSDYYRASGLRESCFTTTGTCFPFAIRILQAWKKWRFLGFMYSILSGVNGSPNLLRASLPMEKSSHIFSRQTQLCICHHITRHSCSKSETKTPTSWLCCGTLMAPLSGPSLYSTAPLITSAPLQSQVDHVRLMTTPSR